MTETAELHLALKQRVRSQPTLLPTVYGDVDFDLVPERLVLDSDRARDDVEAVDLIRTCTMLGDVVADAYAALLPRYGLHTLITMLQQACREDIDAVADAPDELRAFIADLERVPDWLDMGLVAEGARQDRIGAALLSPYIVRGGFLATFMNSYAALPMALTGALSGKRSARRVHETANFFASTVTPGGLDRHGEGFQAAAMVRLMHSMVRFNALHRSAKWDAGVYGIPIPQVDQMPAGMIGIYLLSTQVLAKGRTEFTPEQRARVELARYRMFLLGLPEELIPATPTEIVRMWRTRDFTLRQGFDDSTCGELVRATMSADLRPDTGLHGRLFGLVEGGWSREFFRRNFAGGDRATALKLGVRVNRRDQLVVALSAPFLVGRMLLVRWASQSRLTRDLADRYVVRTLRRRLASYGHAEFTTDHTEYAA